ncbi:MAG: CcdB family protein [Massilia sp.]
MPRFDIYANPNRAATHALFVDVQSDFVRLATRLCIPLYRHSAPRPLLQGAHTLVEVGPHDYVLDTPNFLAVPAVLLRQPAGRLSSSEQLMAQSCIDFMLHGY